MPTIRFYRHAQSTKNEKPGFVGGRSNESPLTELGEQQASQLGGALAFKEPKFVAAFCSGAKRTEQTGSLALQAAGMDLPLQKHEGLLEISQGKLWEGRDRQQPLILPDGTAETYTHPYTRGLDGRVTGGESVAEVGWRMEQALLEIANLYIDEERAEVAVFGHDFALRCLRVRLEDNPDHIRTSVDYCSETTLSLQQAELHITQFGRPLL